MLNYLILLYVRTPHIPALSALSTPDLPFANHHFRQTLPNAAADELLRSRNIDRTSRVFYPIVQVRSLFATTNTRQGAYAYNIDVLQGPWTSLLLSHSQTGIAHSIMLLERLAIAMIMTDSHRNFDYHLFVKAYAFLFNFISCWSAFICDFTS